MNASAVKPALPTGGVQPPKVGLGGPSAAVISPPTQASVSPPKPSLSVTTSPVKPPAPVTVGLNHAPNVPVQAPLSLVQEHRPPVSNVSQQQLRPEKKEYPFAPSVAPPAGSKPTSNGVEGSPNKPVPPPPTVAPPTIEVKKPEENLSDKPNHAPEPAVKLPATTSPQVVAHVAPSLPQPPTAIPPVPPPVVPPVVPPSPAKQEAATPNHTSSAAGAAVETKPPISAPVIAEPVAAAPPPAAAVPPATSSPAAAPAAAPPTVEPPPSKPAAAEVAKVRAEAATKPEFKVATPPRNVKRKKEAKEAANDAKASTSDEDDRKSKRTRTRTQPYQSPNPELTFITKTFKTLTKSPDDKLILFYKNEFLAVRNTDAGFYICQAMQNIYKTSPRIRIRWLSLDKQDGKATDVYTPDFYDMTDFDCILTNLEMKKMDKHRFQLPAEERERTQNILKRALDVELGRTDKAPPVTEEHPDGLDLSLFRDESQLKKRKKGSKKGGKKPKTTSSDSESEEDESEEEEEEDSSESEDEVKKDVKVVKRIETPSRTPARGKAKPKEVASREVAKRAAQVSEREKRASTSKRRSEPAPAAAAPVAAAAPSRTARPLPEKRAKVAVKTPAKRVAEPVAETTTRAAKTRNVKVAAPAAKPAAAPSRGSKEREPRKSAAPPAPAAAKGGRKRPGKKA